MAKAFTPGLTVSARAVYRARRALPLEGEVRVKVGDRVEADTVVAQTFMEGDAFPMKVAGMLGAQPKDLPGLMLVKVGDAVRVGQPVARSKGIFGMMRTEAASTADGTVESVSDSTGMVIVRGPRQPIEVRAFVSGTVAEVLPREGAEAVDALIAPQLAQAWGAAESQAYYEALKRRFKVEIRVPDAAKADKPADAASR